LPHPARSANTQHAKTVPNRRQPVNLPGHRSQITCPKANGIGRKSLLNRVGE
jgi:hypothetical protein